MSFDIARYKHDPEAQERDWRRARELDHRYADRSVFDAENELYYEGGASLVKTLERPVVAAEAQERVRAVAKQLDEAIDVSHSPATRLRLLDSAILGTAAHEPTDAPERGAVRMLDGSPAPGFVDLSGPQMERALEVWEESGRRFSLDQAAASVTRGDSIPNAIDQTGQLSGTQLGPRGELDARIKAHVAEHKCDYVCGLQSAAGPGLRPGR